MIKLRIDQEPPDRTVGPAIQHPGLEWNGIPTPPGDTDARRVVTFASRQRNPSGNRFAMSACRLGSAVADSKPRGYSPGDGGNHAERVGMAACGHRRQLYGVKQSVILLPHQGSSGRRSHSGINLLHRSGELHRDRPAVLRQPHAAAPVTAMPRPPRQRPAWR